MNNEEALHKLMRRVYIEYTNRVGKEVKLSAEEKHLLERVNWFALLGIPQVVYHVRGNTQLQHETQTDSVALTIARTHVEYRVQIPFELGALRLVGLTWKHSGGATVLSGDNAFHIHKGIVKPVKNLERQLTTNDTQSKVVVYSQSKTDIQPFPVEDYKGVDTLHLVIALPALRQWLWGDVPCAGPDCVPSTTDTQTWPFAPSPELAQWMLSNPTARELWEGRSSQGEDVLQAAVHAVQSQSTLEQVVQQFNQEVVKLPPHEASVLRRATEIELQRREIGDLMEHWRPKLAKLPQQSLVNQYHILLQCAEQLRDAFYDFDWERDMSAREFLRRVEMRLNDPQFLPYWEPLRHLEIKDKELPNTLRRALHIVNAHRQQEHKQPLKLRSPIPHEVLKTWVDLQRVYGPSDEVGPMLADYGIVLDPTQLELRRTLWSKFNDLEQLAVRCRKNPQATYECQRLQQAIEVLRIFQNSKDRQQARQELLDTVRSSAHLKPLLDDIMATISNL